MRTAINLKVDKDLIDGILLRHQGKNCLQCLKCGTFLSDMKELCKTLNMISDELGCSEDGSSEELGSLCHDLLKEMIEVGFHEDCFKDSDFCHKWIVERESRFSEKLSDDFGDVVHFKDIECVLLRVDKKCDCFKEKASEKV